jgi:GDP-4-dehydro-6-deoxy-D-mannose reductase
MKTVLVTGATGFCGSYLVELLLSKDFQVIGTKRIRSNTANIKHINNENFIMVDGIDICDISSILELLLKYKPSIIFHLAAQSYVHQSWKASTSTVDVNVNGTYNLLNAIRYANYSEYPKIVLAGSSEEYGFSKEADCLMEESPCVPVSPYGVSKLAATMAGVQNFHSYKIPTLMSRAFNHTGARRDSMFLISNFAKQIVEMELNLREPILRHGNLQSVIDYTNVKDVCQAYLSLANMGHVGEIYNISSGEQFSGNDLLMLLKGATNINFETQIDNDRIRPIDIPVIHNVSSKFFSHTLWEPKIHINQTINSIMEYWREYYKGETE